MVDDINVRNFFSFSVRNNAEFQATSQLIVFWRVKGDQKLTSSTSRNFANAHLAPTTHSLRNTYSSRQHD